MRFFVKVKVDLSKMLEFAQKLKENELDRSLIRSETNCFANDPSVGFSIWEAENLDNFNCVFNTWKYYYTEVEVSEIVSANDAMLLLKQKK